MATVDGPQPRPVVTTKAFERDLKRLRKRGKDLKLLRAVIDAIRLGQRLEHRHRDHALAGEWQGFRDCHVEPDWVLIYSVGEEAVYLIRAGTHSDLFG